MILNVEFVYEAFIVKPRCRKPSVIVIKDAVEVEIAEATASQCPVAFRVGARELRLFNNSLWDYSYHSVVGHDAEKVLASTVLENTVNGGRTYAYSGAGAQAPFKNIWHSCSPKPVSDTRIAYSRMSHWLDDEGVIFKEDVVSQEWISDNREDVIDLIQSRAESMLICDGYIYVPAGEPAYDIQTFGLGHNHGGTAMFIGTAPKVPTQGYFNALQYDEACKYADSVALGRGDTKNVPVKTNCGNIIEVLIPEAVTYATSTKDTGQLRASIQAKATAPISAPCAASGHSLFC